MHYLAKRINELPDQEKQTIISELINLVAKPAITESDQIRLVLMSDFTEEARERLKHFGKMQGLNSGYREINKLTLGFVPGEMTVIAGKTSFGKTTLAMNIANKVALQGKRVLFVTMEMTHAELTSRYMHINGGETEDYYQVAANTIFQENDELDWKSIDGLMRRAREEMAVDMVVIDHLHYFTRELENVAEDLGRITKEIKKNAQRHNVPVILISHVRKTAANSDATMDDLRGSSYISQDADVVLMVGRDKNDSNIMYVRVEKNRNRGINHDDDVGTLKNDRTKLTEEGEIVWNI